MVNLRLHKARPILAACALVLSSCSAWAAAALAPQQGRHQRQVKRLQASERGTTATALPDPQQQQDAYVDQYLEDPHWTEEQEARAQAEMAHQLAIQHAAALGQHLGPHGTYIGPGYGQARRPACLPDGRSLPGSRRLGSHGHRLRPGRGPRMLAEGGGALQGESYQEALEGLQCSEGGLPEPMDALQAATALHQLAGPLNLPPQSM